MKTIYVDSNYICHLTDDGTRTEIETEFFDNKCDIYIEGYRYVPDGSTWVRSDGEQFHGLMVSPARDYSLLAENQQSYEQAQDEALDNEAALIDEITSLCEELIGE